MMAMSSSRPPPELAQDQAIQARQAAVVRDVPVVLHPTADEQLEALDQFTGGEVSPWLPDRVVYLGQEALLVPAGGLPEKLGPEAAHVLAQEVEAVVDLRDAGLLVGEFKTPLGQEVCHERSGFVTPKFLRGARNDEVIRR